MTRFIQQSACEGRRPHGVVPDRLRSRPRLLSRLLEDRGALRLVVAPPGFGKATLAFEYASVMFQFEHVFWLRLVALLPAGFGCGGAGRGGA